MPRTRTSLQELLEKLLGSEHVYYQAPATVKMEYPCIRYSKSDENDRYANNKKYTTFTAYDIVVIDKMPDNKVIKKILELPMSSYDRHYTADNLNHDIIKLFY